MREAGDIHAEIQPATLDLDPSSSSASQCPSSPKKPDVVALESVSGAGWTMHRGDSVKFMRSAVIAGVTFDHVISDPPYEHDAHNNQRRVRARGAGASGHGKSFAAGKRKPNAVEVVPISFAAIDEATRSATAFYCGLLVRRWALFFCQCEAATKWSQAGALAGLVHKRVAIWVKPDGSPQMTGDRPAQGYESIEIMHAPGRSRWNAGGKRGIYTHNTRHRPENGCHGYRRGGREGQDDHDTTKPVALMLEIVGDFTDERETIFDPFAGSGTTGVAAIRLGRRFVGVERDPKSFRLACDRLLAEEQGSTLVARRARQVPLFGAV